MPEFFAGKVTDYADGDRLTRLQREVDDIEAAEGVA